MTQVALSTTVLTDGDGTNWDFNQFGGYVEGGNLNVFDLGADVVGVTFSNDATLSGDGQILTTNVANIGSVSIYRQIFIPADGGYARIVDFITNTSGTPVNYTYEQDTNFDSFTNNWTTWSGDGTLTPQDRWIASEQTSGNDRSGLIVFTDGTLAPTTAAIIDGDDISFTYDLGLAPGETKAIMTFVTQNGTLAESLTDALDLGSLSGDLLLGLNEGQLAQIVNFNVAGLVQFDFFGTNNSDFITGSLNDERFFTFNGDDVISAGLGNDAVDASWGNDFIDGGEGDDSLQGGAGNDSIVGGTGNDIILGDTGSGLVTSTGTATVPSTGQQISISLTLPDTSADSTIGATGFVSRTPVTSNQFNISIVMDISGSTGATFSGARAVGDINGDGIANTVLDAEIEAIETLLNSLAAQVGADNLNVSITGFASGATTVAAGSFLTDTNGNGQSDIIDGLRSLRDSGNTNFEAGLQGAVNFLSGQTSGQNLVFFLSDGANNSGGPYSDEVTALTDPNGINATIRSFGVGNGSDLAELDLVDDGVSNNSSILVTDPSQLGSVLIDPGISQADIFLVEIYVNGVLSVSVPGQDLISTPLGLRYDFTALLGGLAPGFDDVVTAIVYGTDPNVTFATTAQVVEDVPQQIGDDVLLAGSGNDTAYGGGGNDRIDGGSGNDALFGDAGFDIIVGGSGFDFIDGGSENDSVDGGRGADQIFGRQGDDWLSGGIGNDTIDGGAGEDTLIGGAGADRLIGGQGFDTATYAFSTSGVVAGLSAFVNTGEAAGDTYVGVEAIAGSEFADALAGDEGFNLLSGLGGDDFLFGLGGTDFLYGGEGSDSLSGGTGFDYFDGGNGFDTITFASQTSGASVQLFLTGSQILDDGFGNTETLFSIEGLVGTELADAFVGDANANTLIGNGGDDLLFGGAGADYLAGGTGVDTLNGSLGADFFAYGSNDFVSGEWDIIQDFTDGEDFLYLIGFSSSFDITTTDFFDGTVNSVLVSTTALGSTGGVIVYNFTAALLADQLAFA